MREADDDEGWAFLVVQMVSTVNMSKSQYDENQQLDSNVHTTLDEEVLTEAQPI